MLQDASGHRVPATKRVGSAIGGHHIIATVIGAGFSLSPSALLALISGLDIPPHTPCHPTSRPRATGLLRLARSILPRSGRIDPCTTPRVVDQLYGELMRSSACLSASNNPSIAGGC
jgi:hypothetical protein